MLYLYFNTYYVTLHLLFICYVVWVNFNTYHVTLHWIRISTNGVVCFISIHTMLRFIFEDKPALIRTFLAFQYNLYYASFIVNTRFLSYETFTFYHINQHFSTLLPTSFIFFSSQHFILENHHIYQSIYYISHSLPVGKNKNNHKHYHIVSVITVTLFIIIILTTGCHIRSTLFQQSYLFCFLCLRRLVTS